MTGAVNTEPASVNLQPEAVICGTNLAIRPDQILRCLASSISCVTQVKGSACEKHLWPGKKQGSEGWKRKRVKVEILK